MSFVKQLGFIIVILVLLVIYNSFYVVTQGQEGIVLRLGKIVTDNKGHAVIAMPGLHVKLPMIDTVRLLDTRLQTLNVESSRILTQEQKYVIVDYYAKWRIANLPVYYTRTGANADQARLLLQQKINDSLRAEFGRRLLSDVISDARANIMQRLKDQANANARELGIEVIDVRIKRIDLPSEVSASVFDRMRAERELVAAKHRADGKAAAEQIQAEADAKASVILATAEANAAKIRAQGEAEAAKIYADAYGKDPDFYAFYRSLIAYKAVFQNRNDILVLKPDSQFFKYFNGNNTAHR